MSELSIDMMNASREAAITARAKTLKEIIEKLNDRAQEHGWDGRHIAETECYSIAEELQTIYNNLSL